MNKGDKKIEEKLPQKPVEKKLPFDDGSKIKRAV